MKLEIVEEELPKNVVITMMARGATAQLREVVEHADRETAQPIYRELLRLAHKLAWKHNFELQRKKDDRTLPVL